MNKGLVDAETFTGLTVGHAVTIKRGVVVTAILGVTDLDGYAVISNRGVEVEVTLGVSDVVPEIVCE